MVKPRLSMQGLELELAGAAGVVTLLVAGYFLLLRAPLEDALAGQELQSRQQAVTTAINRLQGNYLTQSRQLREGRRVLLMRASWLSHPNLPDEVLARINELARQCDVQISRWQPQGVQSRPEYQAQLFSVDGAASWAGLVRWLALVEEGVPLLDMTHFSITTPAAAGQSGCEFSCILKLYSGSTERLTEVAAAR